MALKFLRSSAALALAAALASCAVGPDYKSPDAATPDRFVAEVEAQAQGGPRPNIDIREWWRGLRDAELNSLVDRALSANLDLEVALNRIQDARARLAAVSATEYPDVLFNAGGGGGTGSDNTNGRVAPEFRSAENSKGLNSISGAGGAVAAWDLDLFGRIKREVEARQADAEALQAARGWTQVTVAADVAKAYLDMRAQQRELVVLGKNIDAARAGLGLAQSRLERGLTNELDVSLAQRELATLQADRAPLVARIDVSRHAIAVLLGTYPESLTKELAESGDIPALPHRIPIGLPADLLRRRPDIREVERQLAAANARVGEAIAELFPSVSLTGAYGLQQGALAPKGSPAYAIWSIGPSLTLPILDFGALDAQIASADFKTREVLVTYREAILKAVQQVDDASSVYHGQQLRLIRLDQALAAAHDATRIANERYDRGLTDFLNVLDAERQQFDLEERHVQTRQIEAEALVDLFRALGGGWREQAIPPIRLPDPAIVAAAKYAAQSAKAP